MKRSKDQRRTARKAELEALTLSELQEIKPYEKSKVAPVKPEKDGKKTISKGEMIETILAHEGLSG